jgi:hypothetical protein
VNAFIILQCLGGLGFLAVGAYCFAVAVLPSWLEKRRRYWNFLSVGNPGLGYHPNSRLAQLGFAKRPGDWDEKTAERVYQSLGLVFSLVGMEMIVLVIRTITT